MSRATSIASGPTLRLVVNDLDAFDEIANDPACFAHGLAKSARDKYVLDHQPTATDSVEKEGEKWP